MSARTIVSGVIHRAPTLKTSSAGNAYALVTIRDGSGDAARWWTAFIFGEDAIAEVERLQAGEPIAVAGEIDAKVYAPPAGQPRVSLSIKVNALLTARKPPKQKVDKARQPRAPALDDRIPF